jgi:hypothetical protein
LDGRAMGNDIERLWEEVNMGYLRYHLGICLKGLKITAKNISQDSQYPS